MKNTLKHLILLLLLFGGAANAQVRTNVYDLEGNEIVSDYMYWGYGLYFSYFSFPDFFQEDSMYIGIGNWGTYALDDIRVITFSHPIIGINEIDASELQLTPNPARDKVTLSGIGDTPQQAVLYNVTGVKLRELTVTDGTTMDISQLPEGLYILRCGSHSAKIVKQKSTRAGKRASLSSPLLFTTSQGLHISQRISTYHAYYTYKNYFLARSPHISQELHVSRVLHI